MAHLAVALLAFAMLSVVFAGPGWWALLLVIPVMLSLVIVRYRTTADRETVTARTLLGSEKAPLGRHRRPALRPAGMGGGAAPRRNRDITSCSDVRDAAAAGRRERRTGTQPYD